MVELDYLNKNWTSFDHLARPDYERFEIELGEKDWSIGQKITLVCSFEDIHKMYNNDGLKSIFLQHCHYLAKKSFLTVRDPTKLDLNVKVQIKHDEHGNGSSNWGNAEIILNEHMKEYASNLGDSKVPTGTDCKLTDLEEFWKKYENHKKKRKTMDDDYVWMLPLKKVQCIKWWSEQKIEVEKASGLIHKTEGNSINFIQNIKRRLTAIYGGNIKNDVIVKMEKTLGLDLEHHTMKQSLSDMSQYMEIKLKKLVDKYSNKYNAVAEKVRSAFKAKWYEDLDADENWNYREIESKIEIVGSAGCPSDLEKFVEGCMKFAEILAYTDEKFRNAQGYTELSLFFMDDNSHCRKNWNRTDFTTIAAPKIERFNLMMQKREKKWNQCSAHMRTEIIDLYKKLSKGSNANENTRDIWSHESQTCVDDWNTRYYGIKKIVQALIEELGLEYETEREILYMLRKDDGVKKPDEVLNEEANLVKPPNLIFSFDTSWFNGGANPTAGALLRLAFGLDIPDTNIHPKMEFNWQLNDWTGGGGGLLQNFDWNENFDAWSPIGSLTRPIITWLNKPKEERKGAKGFFEIGIKNEYPFSYYPPFYWIPEHCGDGVCTPEIGECDKCHTDCQYNEDEHVKNMCRKRPFACGDGYCDAENGECEHCPGDCKLSSNKKEKDKCG
jgi:hypothetical protein